MVGFVLIMLVVAVIFVVFLGIYLRKNANAEPVDSVEISQFLEAAFQYTTTCRISGNLLSVKELITRCQEGKDCVGEKSCDVLRETFIDLIESSWRFEENSPTKGYQLSIVKEINGPDAVLDNMGGPTTIAKPPSTDIIRAAEKPLPGGITLRLEIYS